MAESAARARRAARHGLRVLVLLAAVALGLEIATRLAGLAPAPPLEGANFSIGDLPFLPTLIGGFWAELASRAGAAVDPLVLCGIDGSFGGVETLLRVPSAIAEVCSVNVLYRLGGETEKSRCP